MNIHVIVVGLYPLVHAIGSAMVQHTHCKIWAVQDDSDCDVVEDQGNDVVVWYRTGKHYRAKNEWELIKNLVSLQAKKEDVLVFLNSDDRLNDRNSLAPIKAAYNNPETWVTHGTYRNASGRQVSFNGPYKAGLPFRWQKWHGTHLKTCRYGLWQHLPEDALKRDGEWLRSAVDCAMMYPLMEMAGIARIRYIKQVVYIYNDNSPHNNHKDPVKAREQLDNDKWLRNQKAFERLETL